MDNFAFFCWNAIWKQSSGDKAEIGVRTIYIFNRGSQGGSKLWGEGLSFGLVLLPPTVSLQLSRNIVRLSIWFQPCTVGCSQAWLDCFEQYLQRARFVSQSLEWNGGQPVGFESNIGWNAGGSRASLQTSKTRTKTGWVEPCISLQAEYQYCPFLRHCNQNI